jgi:hypothetical protein
MLGIHPSIEIPSGRPRLSRMRELGIEIVARGETRIIALEQTFAGTWTSA